MVSSNLKNSKQARFVENTLNKTRSKSNLEYLLSQLSDTDSETSEAKFTTTALNSQFIDDVTFHKMSKKSSKSESDLNRFNLYKSSNFEYLLNCLDEPSESMIQNQFFVQIKNIEADKRSIVSKTKTKSTKIDYLKNFKSLKLTDISLLKATVNEIAPVEKEHVLNIGSSAVIIESPLTFKLVKEFEYPLQYIVNYNSTPFIIDKTKTYRKKVINQTKVVSNYTSNILKGKQSDPITADGLVLVKLVKKPNWPNIFGIQLASFMCSKELVRKFEITGFRQDGVVNHLAALDLKNLIGMQIERINSEDFGVHLAMNSVEAEEIIESFYRNEYLIEITVKNILN